MQVSLQFLRKVLGYQFLAKTAARKTLFGLDFRKWVNLGFNSFHR